MQFATWNACHRARHDLQNQTEATEDDLQGEEADSTEDVAEAGETAREMTRSQGKMINPRCGQKTRRAIGGR